MARRAFIVCRDALLQTGGRDFGDKSKRVLRKGQRFPLGLVAVGAHGQDVSLSGACRRDDGLVPIMSGGDGLGRRQDGSALGAKHKAGRAGFCARRSTGVRDLSAGVRRESFLLHYLYGICPQQGIGVRAVLGAGGRNGDDRVIRGGQCGQGQQGGLAAGADQQSAAGLCFGRSLGDLRHGVAVRKELFLQRLERDGFKCVDRREYAVAKGTDPILEVSGVSACGRLFGEINKNMSRIFNDCVCQFNGAIFVLEVEPATGAMPMFMGSVLGTGRRFCGDKDRLVSEPVQKRVYVCLAGFVCKVLLAKRAIPALEIASFRAGGRFGGKVL